MINGKTIVEKIFSKKANQDLRAGDIAVVTVDYGITHDINAPSVFKSLNKLNDNKVKESEKFALFLDHTSPAPTAAAATTHNELAKSAKKHNIKTYYPGEGVCHQLTIESGRLFPGAIAVGTDSHTCTYGIFNALGLSVGASEMAVVLSGSKCWFKVPQTIKVELTGKLQNYSSAKDVTFELLKILGEDGAVYKCIEFCGSGLEGMSLESRAVLANMSVEMGAKTAVMEPDEKLIKWLGENGHKACELFYADENAVYSKVVKIDLSEIKPMVTIPPNIDHIKCVSELEEIPVTQVVIGSCTNGRYEDFEIASRIIGSNKVAPGVKLIIIPASRNIYLKMIESGILTSLINAGAIINTPSCGPCAGIVGGLVGDGEVVVSTTNRCLKGRMGSTKADIYLASPATAAFSAISGKISCQEAMNGGER